jgi:hypothetical protein
MTIHRLTLLLVCTALLSTIVGCASFDRVAVTKFEPIRTEANVQFFKFTAFADAAYPLTSEEAERTRIDWLETWLRDNGHDARKYTVISRVPVLRRKGVIGDIYDIFYEVKVVK